MHASRDDAQMQVRHVVSDGFDPVLPTGLHVGSRAHPLLVYENDGHGNYTVPAFYTLQELKEGIYSQDTQHQTSSVPTPVPDAAALLSQLSMWTYNSENNGLNGNVARDGMTLATVDASDGQGQVNESQNLRGLLQGTYGYCNMWYTTDAFVGDTFGTAVALLLLAVLYVLLYRKYGKSD